MTAAARLPAVLAPLGIAAGLALWAAAATWLQLDVLGIGLLDNSDGFRVLDKAFVPRGLPLDGPGLAPRYPMLAAGETPWPRLVPDSLSALLALAAGTAAKAAGQEAVSLRPLAFLYHLVFAAGMALLLASLTGAPRRAAAAVAAAAMLLCPLTLGYFGSLYEEAAALAGFPLWLALALRAERGPGWLLGFAAATAGLVYAKPAMMLYLIPCLAILAASGGRRRLPLGLALLAVAALGLARNQVRYGDYNALNRVYNGLAYTMAEVSGWQARSFAERLVERQARVDPADATRVGLPPEHAAHWGKSVWPDFRADPEPLRQALAAEGRATAHLARLAAHPALGLALAREATLTAVRADYRLPYLLPGAGAGAADPVLARLGLVLLPLAAACLALALAGRRLAAALVLPALLAPTFVVLADGYYEFEKHLLPYLVTGLLALVGAAELARRRGGAAREL